jgi:hypothetical protein
VLRIVERDGQRRGHTTLQGGPVQALAYIDEDGPAEPLWPEDSEQNGCLMRILVADSVELMWATKNDSLQ